MLAQPKINPVRRPSPQMAGGARFPFRWGMNLTKLPRLTFDEGLRRLEWREVVDLVSYLERMGHLGETTVAELILELDGYIGRTDGADHGRAFQAEHVTLMAEYEREIAARDAERLGQSSTQAHITCAKYAGTLPRLAAFYGRLAGRKVGA